MVMPLWDLWPGNDNQDKSPDLGTQWEGESLQGNCHFSLSLVASNGDDLHGDSPVIYKTWLFKADFITWQTGSLKKKLNLQARVQQ